MQLLILYLLKMTGCSAVLLLYYYLFLRNGNFHQYNRFYLLLSVIASLVFPLISIPLFWQTSSGTTPFYIQTLESITVTNRIGRTDSHFLSHPLIFVIVPYLIVSLSILISLIFSFIRVYRLSKRYSSEPVNNVLVYHTHEKNTPFSFMNKIFWNDNIAIDSTEGEQIFRHELFHVQQIHSLDNIFMQLVLSLAWFNPFFYIINMELKATHEFLADNHAIANADKHDYAEYLVTHALSQAYTIPIAHHFFNSPFKRRIAMILQNSNNSRSSYARKFSAIPLVVLIFCSLAMQTQNPGTAGSTPNKSVSDTTIPDILIKPEFEAEYPGGPEAWQQYLSKTLHYPQSAQDSVIQGAVVVQFIVEKDGSVHDVKAISGPDKGGLKEEAVRVLMSSGKWLPAKDRGHIGTAYKRQPIIFRLETQ